MKTSKCKDKQSGKTTLVLAGTDDGSLQKQLGAIRKDYQGREIDIILRGEQMAPLHIRHSEDAYRLMKKIIGRDMEIQEHFVALYLGPSQKLIGWLDHTTGTTNKVLFDPKIITGVALKALADIVMVGHNHPGERKLPTASDVAATEALKKGCSYFGIRLLDHLILTSHDYYSLADHQHASLNGLNDNQNNNLIRDLRQEILSGLKNVTEANSPNLWKQLQTKEGYHHIEKEIVRRVITWQLVPSAIIPQMESEMDELNGC